MARKDFALFLCSGKSYLPFGDEGRLINYISTDGGHERMSHNIPPRVTCNNNVTVNIIKQRENINRSGSVIELRPFLIHSCSRLHATGIRDTKGQTTAMEESVSSSVFPLSKVTCSSLGRVSCAFHPKITLWLSCWVVYSVLHLITI